MSLQSSGNKTVYFLGAGASKASEYGLPVMEGFFREEDLESKDYRNLSKFRKKRFANTPCEKLNLETVATFLDLALDSFGSLGKRAEPRTYEAKMELDRYVAWRLGTPERQKCPKHSTLLGNDLAGKDSKNSVISLNYDLVVDNTLYALSPKEPNGGHLAHGCLLDRMYGILGRTELFAGERPSLYPQHKELGFCLKLHGSIDWLYCPNVNCGNHQLFFPNQLGSEEIHDKPGDPCSLCGSPLVNVIVPPTMHKTFDRFPKLGLLWSLAYRELNKADRIVIFGVSFASSDYYLGWLLHKAVTDRESKPVIIDIDVDPDVCKTIESLTAIEPSYKPSLDEFLSGEKPRG